MSKQENYIQNDIKIIKTYWESFLARPGMYMGKKSLFGLQCFMAGLQMAEIQIGCGPRKSDPRDKFFDMSDNDWMDFEKWVSQKTKHKGRCNAIGIAAIEAKDDDVKGFDIWAEWFKEWKNEKVK